MSMLPRPYQLICNKRAFTVFGLMLTFLALTLHRYLVASWLVQVMLQSGHMFMQPTVTSLSGMYLNSLGTSELCHTEMEM